MKEPIKSPGGRKLVITRKEKRDLSEVTMEEFLEQDFINNIDSDEKDKNTGISTVFRFLLYLRLYILIFVIFFYADEDSEQYDSDSDSEGNLDSTEHKRSLIKLQDTDPDFYEYLKENDKNLLNFEVSNNDRNISNENLEVYIFYK